MSLSPEQFNEVLKNTGKRGKMTVAGERFVHHDELINRGLSPYPEHSDASWGAGWVASDGYGLSPTPIGGLRSVFTPEGKELEDVPTHKYGVAVIQQHRAGEHDSQKPREPRQPRGLPMKWR
jgi:hypothetical protein